MSQPTPVPASPAIFADPLWNTSILPDISGKTKTPGLAASINGIRLVGGNPVDGEAMIRAVNANISIACYNGSIDGYDCLTMCLGSRYVIMTGGPDSVPFTVPQLGDQLIVRAPGGSANVEYIQTDWRTPPNYLPGA
jgi:hypothetical protein